MCVAQLVKIKTRAWRGCGTFEKHFLDANTVIFLTHNFMMMMVFYTINVILLVILKNLHVLYYIFTKTIIVLSSKKS